MWTTHIEGRYRAISVHQLAMAWWCFQSKHITKRQLRIWFAAQEMLERRRYTAPPNPPKYQSSPSNTPQSAQPKRKPSYTLHELKSLVGGKGSKTADAALSADLKKLGALGLVLITEHSITFATSIEQLCFGGSGGAGSGSGGGAGGNDPTDDIHSFWTMFNQLPHPRRRVPVPRRVLRALAGGFTTGMTAVVLATLIRSLFWHKDGMGGRRGSSGGACGSGGGGVQSEGEGVYRVDGRTKREWISETFGITRRTVTDARARLIELGWLIPLETHQHLLNRYGTHDQINTNWTPPTPQSEDLPSAPADEIDLESGRGVEMSGGGEVYLHDRSLPASVGKSSTPSPEFSGESSSLINRSSSPTGNSTTRKPAPHRAGPAGASLRSALKSKNQSKTKSGSRKKKLLGKSPRRSGRSVGRGARGNSPSGPNIRDIQLGHLQDTPDLLELYRQAITIGLASPSEAGRLDFLALAEHAKAHGKRAGAMFYWLLREKKSGFITQGEEDAAARRLRELHTPVTTTKATREWWGGYGDRGNQQVGKPGLSETPDSKSAHQQSNPASSAYSRDEQFVIACMRVAQKHRIGDAFRIAHAEGWTRERWEKTVEQYEATMFAIRQEQLMDQVKD